MTYHYVKVFSPSDGLKQARVKFKRAEYITINVIHHGKTKEASQVERAD